MVEKAVSVTEDLLRKGLADADATARKHCRKYVQCITLMNRFTNNLLFKWFLDHLNT